jgi:soluble lytic murein transglycosylase-like protein
VRKRLLKKLKQHWRWLLLATVCVASPIALINAAVAYFGDIRVFLLSPFSLKPKARAVATYLAHRPLCLLTGHPPMEPLIREAETKYGLPRGLLAALIETESATRPHRISHTGAMGPAQLIASTAQQLAVGDPFDSAEAVDAGAKYLAEQLIRFKNVKLAVAAYNAGPNNVRGAIPRNGETEFYVARVMTRYEQLRPRKTKSARR